MAAMSAARLFSAVALLALPGAVSDDAQCPAGVTTVPKATCTGPASVAEFVAKLQADGYDQTQRPPCVDGNSEGPTIIDVQLRLTQLNQVDAKLGTVSINGYFRQWWKDPRLAFDDIANGGCTNSINFMESQLGDNIWVPDIYVDNLVKSVKDGMVGLTAVYPDGSVWRSVQILWDVKVNFDLGPLPYDKHTAMVSVASYSQDTTQLRVRPKGGDIGAGSSGIGLSAAPMDSAVWYFGEGVETDGFETEGVTRVEFDGSWDYVDMIFHFERRSKFFISQVVVPCTLFLWVSYIQFFVDPAAAPARAALAVTPVLIMRLMSNSIYKSIPEGGKNMWLDDFVTTSMFLCCFAAGHFGIVQYWRLVEKARQAKLDGLIKSKEIALRLDNIATKKNLPLVSLLTEFAPVTKDVSEADLKVLREKSRLEDHALEQDEVAATDSAGNKPQEAIPKVESSVSIHMEQGGQYNFASETAKHEGITEADMLFIIYARDIFRHYDKDESNHVCMDECRAALTYFNIYMSKEQIQRAVARFLRDSDTPTPVDESTIQVTFSEFTRFMVVLDRYTLRKDISIFRYPSAYFQSIPVSVRWDVIARFTGPIFIFLQYVIFYSMLASGSIY